MVLFFCELSQLSIPVTFAQCWWLVKPRDNDLFFALFYGNPGNLFQSAYISLYMCGLHML